MRFLGKTRSFFTKLVWKYPETSKTLNIVFSIGLMVGFLIILFLLESDLLESDVDKTKTHLVATLAIIWGVLAIFWWKVFATHYYRVKQLPEYQIEQAEKLLKPWLNEKRAEKIKAMVEETKRTGDAKKLKDWLREDYCSQCVLRGCAPLQQDILPAKDCRMIK